MKQRLKMHCGKLPVEVMSHWQKINHKENAQKNPSLDPVNKILFRYKIEILCYSMVIYVYFYIYIYIVYFASKKM